MRGGFPIRRGRGFAAAWVLLGLFTFATNQAAGQAQFIPLGFLPNGNSASVANAVSNQAPYAVVGYANTQQVARLPFRWTQAGGMQSIGTGLAEAEDVSADGSVVVGGNSTGTVWRWTVSSGVKSNFGTGSVSAVSADGSVIVGANGDRGYRWTQSTGQVSLPLLPGALSNYNPALGLSDDGRYVVGQGRSTVGYRGYRYDPTTNAIAALDPSGAGNVTDSARSISPDGQFITGSAGSKMGRWVNGALTNAVSNSSGSYLGQAITGDGNTIVGYALLSASVNQGFIWDADHGIREIKQALSADYGLGSAMTGWTFTAVNDISADGRAIVGVGTDPNGFAQAFLAIVPEPSSACLLAIGSIFTAARRRR